MKPYGIAIATNLFVSFYDLGIVREYTAAGATVRTMGEPAVDPLIPTAGELSYAFGVAVDDKVYVTDAGNNYVSLFTLAGAYSSRFQLTGATAQGRGIALSDAYGSVSFDVGQSIDIVCIGRVTGYSGMTPGAAVYGSVNAGRMDQTAPALQDDYPVAIGWAESATTIFVFPQIAVPTVNPS